GWVQGGFRRTLCGRIGPSADTKERRSCFRSLIPLARLCNRWTLLFRQMTRTYQRGCHPTALVASTCRHCLATGRSALRTTRVPFLAFRTNLSCMLFSFHFTG